jgi:DNA-directed RNA polymerase subunit RPC12/RpoP
MLCQIRCDQCRFHCGGFPTVVFAVREDGLEVQLPHRGRDSEAREVTGKSLDELRDAGRLRHRSAQMCLCCGEVGYYGDHEGQVESILESQNEAIRIQVELDSRDPTKPDYALEIRGIPADQIHRNLGYQCASCGQKQLHAVSQDFSWLRQLIDILKKRRRYNTCPKCNQGILHWAPGPIT